MSSCAAEKKLYTYSPRSNLIGYQLIVLNGELAQVTPLIHFMDDPNKKPMPGGDKPNPEPMPEKPM